VYHQFMLVTDGKADVFKRLITEPQRPDSSYCYFIG